MPAAWNDAKHPSRGIFINDSDILNRITVHRRDAAGAWVMRVAIAGGRVAVESVGAELVVDTIYRNSSIA